jgi:hypothetical protein
MESLESSHLSIIKIADTLKHAEDDCENGFHDFNNNSYRDVNVVTCAKCKTIKVDTVSVSTVLRLQGSLGIKLKSGLQGKGVFVDSIIENGAVDKWNKQIGSNEEKSSVIENAVSVSDSIALVNDVSLYLMESEKAQLALTEVMTSGREYVVYFQSQAPSLNDELKAVAQRQRQRSIAVRKQTSSGSLQESELFNGSHDSTPKANGACQKKLCCQPEFWLVIILAAILLVMLVSLAAAGYLR